MCTKTVKCEKCCGLKRNQGGKVECDGLEMAAVMLMLIIVFKHDQAVGPARFSYKHS